MYLDISPIRSGKTARLLKLMSGEGGIYVAPGDNDARRAKSLFTTLTTPTVVSISKFVGIDEFAGHDIFNVMDGEKVYFDDFDNLDQQPRWPLLQNARYATTPKYLRTLDELRHPRQTDLLARLLTLNQFSYYSFHPASPLTVDHLSTADGVLDDSIAITRLFGGFVK